MTLQMKNTDIALDTVTVTDSTMPQIDESQFHRATVRDSNLNLTTPPPKFLLLYGLLRERSFNRLVVEEYQNRL